MDEVGQAFCKILSIMTDNPDTASCEQAWEKQQAKEIDEQTLNGYLDDTYGAGMAHKAKSIILAIVQNNGGGH